MVLFVFSLFVTHAYFVVDNCFTLFRSEVIMSVNKQFLTAGNAIFTVQLPPDSQHLHYTYRIRKVESPNYPTAYFVSLLTGPDNTRDYTYLGMMNPIDGTYRETKKSRMRRQAFPVKLFERIMLCIFADNHTAYEKHGYRTIHNGKCGRCGRLLTVPESVESGIGPECRKHL